MRKKKDLNYSHRFFNYAGVTKISMPSNCDYKPYSVKISVLFLFSDLMTCTNPTIYWDATLLVLILHLTVFEVLCVYQIEYA